MEIKSPEIQEAITLINNAHAADPKGAELAYADSIEKWISILSPNASLALKIAARCQHFERWVISRDSYPMDRPGYLKWRRAVALRQGERAKEILLSVGIDEEFSQRVATLCSKSAPLNDPDAQALEDAACLVFLNEQIDDFAPKYDEEKLIGIIQKTWKKMSEHGHELALKINYSDSVKTVLGKALASA